MTRDEFKGWLKYHCQGFSSLGDWFARLGEKETEDVLAHWYRVLRPVDVIDASRATDRLFAGEEPEPKSRDHIPRVIRAIAYRLRLGREETGRGRKFYDGEEAFRCLTCQDDGRVIVWSAVSRRAAREGRFGERFTLYTEAAACGCQAGERWRKLTREHEPRRDVLADTVPFVGDPAEVARVAAALCQEQEV